MSTSAERGAKLPANIREEIDCMGYCPIRGAVPPALLGSLQSAANDICEANGRRNISVIGAAAFRGAFRDIEQSEWVTRTMQALSGAQDAPYSVLRIIEGREADTSASFNFHYDSSIVTALVPILIPEGDPETAGDFICFPNHRPIRKTVAANLAEKALMQNPLTRRRFQALALSRHPSATIIRLRPGSIYFFWGYRTYHANFPVAAGRRRATLLLHMGDPHPGSKATELIKLSRRMRVERALSAG